MQFNQSLFNSLFSFAHRNGLLDGVIIFFAQYLTYILIFFILVLLAREPFRRRVFFFAEISLAVLLARGVITETFRFFYIHPRPFDALGIASLIPESGNSFPSGHMTFLFAMLVAVYVIDRRAGIFFGLGAFVVGFARIASGVHWPLDIAGGIIIGWGVGYLAHRLLAPYFVKLATEETPQS
ncbi:MAG: phosphatase PAP2 family protein [bacterium]|nr:phosphatase PAP2 family protein [bacterium]